MWSPDGSRILYSTTAGANPFYGNTELAVIPAGGGEPRILTADFDENPAPVAWTDEGVFFVASQRTARHLFVLDPESGEVSLEADTPEMIATADLSSDGSAMALQGEDRTTVGEIFRVTRRAGAAGHGRRRAARHRHDRPARRPGATSAARRGHPVGERGRRRDRGVLMKPPGYDPGRTYPLMVVIHGGPTGTSRPQLVGGYVYPVLEWLRKGAVVMMPNYRGSAGYGADFRALNVRNLGVGDAWDVLSGVEALVDRGIADPERVAAMGWSQGGYISAFLTTSSDRFRAISVGAGISNWMTYYVNTDIHSFTREYLEGDPVGRPRDLREDLADDLYQAGQHTDAHSARRIRRTRPHTQRLRTLPGSPGCRCRHPADHLQGLRPRDHQAARAPRRHVAQLGVVRPPHLG